MESRRPRSHAARFCLHSAALTRGFAERVVIDQGNESLAVAAETLRRFLARARAAAKEGQLADAELAYQEVLNRDPEHPEALNFLGGRSLARGDFAQGTRLLERAAAVAPGNPEILNGLGIAYLAGGAYASASQILERALIFAPDLFEIRLHLGAAQEKLGRRFPALASYVRAIREAQRSGVWLDEKTTPSRVLPLVSHAMGYIARFRRRLMTELLEDLSARFGRSELRRFERFLSSYLGESPCLPLDERQKPKLYFFPGLPSSPYFDRGLFPWLADLEARTDAIAAELDGVLSSPRSLEPFLQLSDPSKIGEYLGGSEQPPAWDAFFFFRHGQSYDEHLKSCPSTAQALSRVPLARVAGNAPEVLFSVLAPGTHILPHHGVTNTRSVVHLPLRVPPDCALRVAGELHVWKRGQCVIFDDTYEHEAWNRSGELRVVLILDVWNPYLSAAECAALATLIPEINTYHQAMDGTAFTAPSDGRRA